jgi:(p)ppGpp synthase/HD superfamily hydrolase
MASGDEDALVCALLHDVVEDGDVDLDEIRQEFGDAAGDAVG